MNFICIASDIDLLRNPFRKKYSWEQIISEVLTLPKHKDLKVNFSDVQELPPEFAERPSDNDGQIADYGIALEDGTGIHVKKYDEHYKIHWDESDPIKDPLGHLLYDAPQWIVIGAVGADLLLFKGKYTKKVLNFVANLFS